MMDATSAIIEELAKYLELAVPQLKEVHREFPATNRELEKPIASLITVSNPFTNRMRYIISKTDIPGDSNHKSVLYVVGQYDYKLQLDIWAETKAERSKLYDLVFRAINKDFFDDDANMGISLKLADYFNTIARYELVDYTFDDSEQSSQTDSWRVKMILEGNCKAHIEKCEAIMRTITVEQEVNDQTDTYSVGEEQ